jgi:hypothetical protein
MRIERQEELVRRLLAPLDRVEPVTLVSNDRGRRRRRSLALAVAFVVGAGGLAAAAVSGPLSGVFSAAHPRSAADVLDPGTAAMLRSDEVRGDAIGVRLLDQSRLLGTLPMRRRVYLVPTSKGRLCVVVERLAESCGDPLTQAAPLTFTVVDPDRAGRGEGPVAYGVARDGVVSVSFTVGGRRETVPIHHNLFAFQARPTDRSFSAPTVRFADGTSETLR